MADRPFTSPYLRFLAIFLWGAVSLAHANQESPGTAAWKPVTEEAVADRLEEYLRVNGIAPDRQVEARTQWKTAAGEAAPGDLLDRLVASLAKADDRVQQVVDYCGYSGERAPLPDFAWLADSETPVLLRSNVRLFWARWLVQEAYYDEAVAWTDGLTPSDVVSPELLLFYRAVAHQRLVQPDKADSELSQLLQRQDDLPTRYQKLADLMQKDLTGLENESLDHISRRMADVRRRLVQGRAGEPVQQVEKGVVDSLDKLIKDIEDQLQKQAQAASAGSSGGQPSGSPMQDSQLPELKAPGNVEHRDIGNKSGWGNLPEKDREKAMQEIGRDFPSHYREVIEEYFRRLAAEESVDNP